MDGLGAWKPGTSIAAVAKRYSTGFGVGGLHAASLAGYIVPGTGWNKTWHASPMT